MSNLTNYRVIDTVGAAYLETDDIFEFCGEVFTVSTVVSDNIHSIDFVVTDAMGDDIDLTISTALDINLLEEVDD